ncbi:hypothetical protein GJA_914 [Janthinobacterium agaricidamnosum NBRC 102515 = DSM 9628]|uniref:Uncharacterized protein n=1 Tax=Janthinobacterium agaricidamnosum NBRC 102515 = DSM 9628 TaxID=1349767 RepID=W0V1T7_9BURK|nr:hypothetical protein GJA_914 [Janthinobacterium agaricidamnosum NBRC 102515 = DSM 9628]
MLRDCASTGLNFSSIRIPIASTSLFRMHHNKSALRRAFIFLQYMIFSAMASYMR